MSFPLKAPVRLRRGGGSAAAAGLLLAALLLSAVGVSEARAALSEPGVSANPRRRRERLRRPVPREAEAEPAG